MVSETGAARRPPRCPCEAQERRFQARPPRGFHRAEDEGAGRNPLPARGREDGLPRFSFRTPREPLRNAARACLTCEIDTGSAALGLALSPTNIRRGRANGGGQRLRDASAPIFLLRSSLAGSLQMTKRLAPPSLVFAPADKLGFRNPRLFSKPPTDREFSSFLLSIALKACRRKTLRPWSGFPPRLDYFHIIAEKPAASLRTRPLCRELGNRLTVDQRTLTPLVLVRIQVPQPTRMPLRISSVSATRRSRDHRSFSNQIKRLSECRREGLVRPHRVR